MTSHPVTNQILYLDDVTVSFDGFKALNALSFVVEPGEMRAIIGPNGAGKTTMMDVITGKTRPDTGTALFDGTYDLTTLDEAEIAELGIGRKFQRPTVFEFHSVADNIRLALAGPRTTLSALFGERNRITSDRIDEILARVRLLDQRNRIAGELSHGQKQWLEIGMLLGAGPQAAARRRAGRRHDRRRDRKHRRALARDRQVAFGDCRRARHDLRARARRQGDLPA